MTAICGDTKIMIARCGRYPTPEGYDACMGYISGASAACCGHGVERRYILYDRKQERGGANK